MPEYAKFAKIVPQTNTLTNRGFQGYVTLPSSKSMPSGYINMYCGVAGFECGVSSAADSRFYDPTTKTYKWHWFVNGPEVKNGEPYTQFKDGERIHLKLVLRDDGFVEFFVNFKSVFVSQGTYTTSSSTDKAARFIFGTLQNQYETLPSQLPAWKLSFSKITCDTMMFKGPGKNADWINVTSSNTKAILAHTPTTMTNPAPADINGTTNDLANARYAVSMTV
ncbi:hypothetical protein ACE41H_22960 [Paenibacillus enshidis]|uniref:Uncharacterized protein n=1 Tax=Paenibacillus enshidis TaxID=1458439 RepID=A0ABV5AZH5_9BACL